MVNPDVDGYKLLQPPPPKMQKTTTCWKPKEY